MRMQILEQHPLQSLNTFGIAATAARFVAVDSEDALRAALAQRHPDEPLLLLGGGSNMLLTRDFPGLVIQICIPGRRVVHEDDDTVVVEAGAGEVWHQLVLHTVAQGWGGIENLSLIPGCVGAAPIQNIGAYGVELRDVFAYLEAMSLTDGQLHRFEAEACAFGYRDSVFKQALRGQYAITRVALRLRKRGHQLATSYGAIADELQAVGINPATADIAQLSAAVIRIRQSKLPDPQVIGNAGSFFKNPEIPASQYAALQASYPNIPGYVVSDSIVKVPAGWLIEQAGWKGKRFGSYGVHDKQALVLVNHGGAQGADLLQLSSDIMDSIRDQFGIALEREVNVI
jgi:UDP-N-acetylmuramate dehydrogenase